jgi:hypothetical protein
MAAQYGAIQEIKYFAHIEEGTLTWVELLLNDGKVDLYSPNDDSMEYLLHLER